MNAAKVLIIDDHDTARESLVKLLRMEGFETIGAANSLEGLSLASRHRPHLVLLDVMLPPMDGLTFLMLLRERPEGREMPVILLTGLSDPQTTARARELGVREHLVKAVATPAELIAAVRRHAVPVAPASS